MPSSPKSIPVESEWPTYLSTSVVINAPRQKVWDVLVDFAGYAKWNPYIRECTLLDASKAPVHGRGIAADDFVTLKLHMPPAMDSVKLRAMAEHVKHVEPLSQLAWGGRMPGWLHGSEHWNVLTEIDGGTKFEIIRVFSGVVIRALSRDSFADAIEAMAQGLKARCEKS
ncbi:hypothetical protein DFH07DRAFT_809297 [Mycena maculata]|uniref:SRPBCC domain-containing protein n=1 Tax=Mycena maculata TaxID=230809 RepID=A0AAD7JK37_9AGAR|nr:hypothetical protein DFH07DRAFT_809297 [Mycena maculata]